MNRFKNHLIAMAVLSVLAIVGSIMNSHQAAAQGPPNGLAVNIVNPLPVPVTGSTTVSGTIAATQSGAWNVGLTPGASVGITGTPNVNVTNPATAPVLFLNVNDPGRIAYQSVTRASCVKNTCNGVFPAVPSGHRLVIQHFSGSESFSQPTDFVEARLLTPSSAVLSVFLIPSNIESISDFDQAVLVYYDAGEQPFAQSNAIGVLINQASFTLTGYMLDCTIAPCAAIAH
jgi:hypothetical protein